MIVAGRVSQKMAPVLRQIYDQMGDPKWVISMGVCASSGGMFNNYAIVQGVDHIVPVDIYLPGCPPRPEMLLDSIVKLHDKILNMKLGANREAEIEQLEQARLRRLPLAVQAGGHDFARPEPQQALPEPAPPQPWPFLAQPGEAQNAARAQPGAPGRPAGPEPEPGSHG
jgi:NADH ubiquinone oxidoreductase, 20 Kd subunit